MFKCYDQHLTLQQKKNIKGEKLVQKRPVRVSGLFSNKKENSKTERF
jgi:hypothetical protein